MTRVAGWLALWAVVLGSVGFTGYVAVHGTRVRPTATAPIVVPTPSPTRTPTVALFIGDSYLGGSTSVPQSSTFGPLACTTLGWICYYEDQPGAGYVSRGSGATGGAYPSWLGEEKKYLPDVVVVSGGEADLGAGDVQAVAAGYLRNLRRQFSSASVYVLQPFWVASTASSQIPPEMLALQRQVRLAAASSGVRFVPTTGWLKPSLMTAGGGLPDTAGHEAMATRLVTVLEGGAKG